MVVVSVEVEFTDGLTFEVVTFSSLDSTVHSPATLDFRERKDKNGSSSPFLHAGNTAAAAKTTRTNF